MPITTQNINQFGQDAPKVLSYISLRRALFAVGGIQFTMAIVLMISAIILGFREPAYVTIGAMLVVGACGVVLAKFSPPIDAPYILARRLRRMKVFSGLFIILMCVVLILAILTVAWELWEIVEVAEKRSKDPRIQLDFSDAFDVVTCATIITLTAVPICTFAMDLRQLTGTKIDHLPDGM